MSWYQTQLLQANPQLMTMGTTLQNQAGSQMLNSLTGGLNDISKYKQVEEDRAYQDLLNQHIASMQHLNAGTENERINPLATANGNSIYSYLSNASNYVKGMTPDRAGSLFNKFLQQRTAQANVEQNLLNSKIKQNAQQQATAMQNYINQVGDANKDGLIDVRDLNPTEQTAVNGLYGSVANKLLGTAQQHGDLLSKFNIQHKNRLGELKTQNDYALERQSEAFKHQDKIAQMQNARAILGSYQTLYNKSYNDYIKLSQYNPATMTPDQKLQLSTALNNMNLYGNKIKNLQSMLLPTGSATQTQLGSNLANNNIASVVPHMQNSNSVINHIVGNNATNTNSNIVDKVLQRNPVAEYPSVFMANNGTPEPTREQAMSTQQPNANWLVHAGQTNAQVAKQVNTIKDLYKDYNKYSKVENSIPFYSIVKNELAKKINNNVNSNYKVNYDNTAMNKILDLYNTSLSHTIRNGFVDEDVAKTLGVPELANAPASILYAKILSQIDEAIANTTDKDAVKQLQSIKNNLNGYGKQINLNEDVYNPSIFTKLKNDVAFGANTITAPFGLDIYKGKQPEDINAAMITFGKMLINKKPDLVSNKFGFHVGSTVLDGTAKDIAIHFLPKVKLALANYYNINPQYIKNDYVKDFIYKGLLSGTSGQTHLLDGIKEATGFGSIYHAKPKPILLNIINSIK